MHYASTIGGFFIDAVLAALCALASAAESYPAKPTRLIVPLPLGGLSDGLARIIAQNLAQEWGQQMVVDSRPGASTILAANG